MCAALRTLDCVGNLLFWFLPPSDKFQKVHALAPLLGSPIYLYLFSAV
jgi:hypothetical protein